MCVWLSVFSIRRERGEKEREEREERERRRSERLVQSSLLLNLGGLNPTCVCGPDNNSGKKNTGNSVDAKGGEGGGKTFPRFKTAANLKKWRLTCS